MHRPVSTLLSAVLLFPSVASAADLADYLEAWTVTRTGQNGSDREDSANGVAITSANGVIAVGQVDGAAGFGHDALALEIAPDQSVTWEETFDSGRVGQDGRLASEDHWNAVAIDAANDDWVLCGTRGLVLGTDPLAMFQVEGHPVSTADWATSYRYSSSQIQECRGVAIDTSVTWAAGWAQNPTDQGRWIALKMDASGTVNQTPTTYDYQQNPQVPDQAHGTALHAVSGEVTIVGERGVSAAPNRENVDWHVRQYNPGGNTRLWEATYSGSANLIDRATAVVVDPISGDSFVVGYTNKGTDNAGNVNYDWRVARYGRAGDGSGGPDEKWATTWESAAGASEGATAVTLDDGGDLLVAGWAIDASSGKEIWRVAKFNAYDGYPAGEWLGPVGAGDARPNAIAFRNDLIAIGGVVQNAQGNGDFVVTLLDVDDDGDGTPNSVDACPTDEDKAADEGICGCGVSDVDTDGDGVEDCNEACDGDPDKTEPGVCGCDRPDEDTDGDGTLDCNDACPDDPDKTVNDITTGGCGCGAPNTDTDGDGVLGCHDACAGTPPGEEVDEFGCPAEEPTTDDTGDTSGTDDGGGDKKGCGCDTGAPASGGLLLVGLAALALRRRRAGR